MEMEENFNLDDSSREMPDLHLNPTEFANKLKRVGNNQIIWPPPKVYREPLEIEVPSKSLSYKIKAKFTNYVSQAKITAYENLREFVITLPNNLYSGAKKTGNLAYNSVSFLYNYISQKTQFSEEEITETLEDGWVFILHSSKHNDRLENLKQKAENPEIIFTQQNMILKNANHLPRNSSILTENSNGRLEELWEFNELLNRNQRIEKEEDTFSILDVVPDYDDLDYAVAMPEEEIEWMFSQYIRNHPNEFKENKKQSEDHIFGKIQYPELIN